MKRALFSLFFFAAGLAAPAMTPAEFTALYEKPGKTAEDCYKLFEAYRDGDGTEKNESCARKWVLAAHEAGMISARKDIATLPWRTSGKHQFSPSIPIAEVDDATARALGEELISRLVDDYTFTGGASLKTRPASKATMKEVQRLIAEGADLNVWTADEQHGQLSALYLACMNNDLRLAGILIEHGADPSANNNRAITVSFENDSEANSERYEKEIKEGMKKGGFEYGNDSISRKDRRKKESREKKQSKERRQTSMRVFSFLINNGADVQLYSNAGWTLMYYAAFARSPLGVAMLVRAGLSPDKPQNPHEYAPTAGSAGDLQYMVNIGHVADKGVPLSFATENAMPFVVEALLKAKANPNVKDAQGRTPLDIALSDIELRESEKGTKSTAGLFLRRSQDIAAALRKAGGKTSAGGTKN